MYSLELVLDFSILRTFFDNEPDAKKELDLLRPKIGKGMKYGVNIDDSEIHTINAPTGPIDVVCNKVQAAFIVDKTKMNDITKDHDEMVHDRAFARLMKERQALKDAGLDQR